MLIRVSDPHEVLDEIFRDLLVDGRQPAMVKSRWIGISSEFRSMRILIVVARSFAMVVDIIRSVLAGQRVVVREFWNVPLLCMSPLLFGWRRKILWNVNHNLRSESGSCPMALSLAARLGFRFLLFDGVVAVAGFPGHVQRAFRTPLFPMTERPRARRAAHDPLRVSLVGDMRAEKVSSSDLGHLVQGLSRLPGIRVRMGVRSGASPAVGLPPGVGLADTSTRIQFLGLLAESDIVVILARREAYYYRHSGTVLDAISSGAWPVVPAFPVLQSQVEQPDRVGSTYSSVPEITTVVKAAITSLESMEERRARYFAGRGKVNVQLEAADGGAS